MLARSQNAFQSCSITFDEFKTMTDSARPVEIVAGQMHITIRWLQDPMEFEIPWASRPVGLRDLMGFETTCASRSLGLRDPVGSEIPWAWRSHGLRNIIDPVMPWDPISHWLRDSMGVRITWVSRPHGLRGPMGSISHMHGRRYPIGFKIPWAPR